MFFTIITDKGQSWGRLVKLSDTQAMMTEPRERERGCYYDHCYRGFSRGFLYGSRRPLAIIIMPGDEKCILFRLLFNYLCAVFLWGMHEMDNICACGSRDSLATCREKEQGRG